MMMEVTEKMDIHAFLTQGEDGIFSYSFSNQSQVEEIKFLFEISHHHSIPVMDHEVARFLGQNRDAADGGHALHPAEEAHTPEAAPSPLSETRQSSRPVPYY